MNTSKIASAGKYFSWIGYTMIISTLIAVIQYFFVKDLDLLIVGVVLNLICFTFIAVSFLNAGSTLSSLNEEVDVSKDITGDSALSITEREFIEDTNKNKSRSGKPFEGGIIVYTDEKGEHGLICSKNDLGEGNWEEAKELCEEYKEGGFSDWRLPNLEEINFIYLFIHKKQNFFSNQSYWSSFESEKGDLVWRLNFNNGEQKYYNKIRKDFILFVRDF